MKRFHLTDLQEEARINIYDQCDSTVWWDINTHEQESNFLVSALIGDDSYKILRRNPSALIRFDFQGTKQCILIPFTTYTNVNVK
tara:strand:+ start:1728 stop:1982 length:255 start_codon:yes stop_codon:yes gene_type:complete